MTEAQTVINILTGLVAFFGGWVMNGLRDAIKSLQKTDSQLATKVQAIELLVAGKYMQRDEFEKSLTHLGDAIFKKIDQLGEKLDTKADKSTCMQIHRDDNK